MAPLPHPVSEVPPNYSLVGTLKPLQDRKILLWLNLLGLVLFFLSGWLFTLAVAWLRPGSGVLSFEIKNWEEVLVSLLVMLLIITLMILLHEGVHGLGFWYFSKARPIFGFRGYYAFASAPGWYFPKAQYLVICLAPFVVLSILGLILIPILPQSWLLSLVIFLTLNASGAIGDLFIAAWVLRFPATALALDQEESTSIYLPPSP